MADETEKRFPSAPEGVRGLLNMEGGGDSKPSSAQASGAPPSDLPFMEDIEEPVKTTQIHAEIPKEIPSPLGGPAPAIESGPVGQIIAPADKKGNELYSMFLWSARNVLPYLVIFAIAIGLYAFYFSNFSFLSLFNKNLLKIESLTSANQNKELAALKKAQQDDYVKWIKQFFFDVNDESIISMDTDVSGNGLSNFEKYLLNLNPKVYSTRGNMGDGEAVLQNINPWTGKSFTNEQKTLIDKYLNKELISNRITAAALTRGVTKFAQYVNPDSPYYIDPATLQQANSNNQSISSPETLSNQQTYQTAVSSNQTNRTPSSQIDETVPGQLDIPANNISVPLIWTQNVSDFDADLKKGVVHYPGTPFPGEIGTSYISGHSSGYLWDRSPYKQVFAVLGQVKDGTSFTITVKQKDGKQVIYHYVVVRRGEFAANDQAQFISGADSVVALSTCWPVGTTDRRLVLFAKLTQTEK